MCCLYYIFTSVTGCAQQGWSHWICALCPVPVHVLLSLGGNFGSENRSSGCLGSGRRLLCSCSLVVKACQCADDTGAPSCPRVSVSSKLENVFRG